MFGWRTVVLETETNGNGFVYIIKVFGLQPEVQGHYKIFATG